MWKSTDGGQSWRPLWDEQDTMASTALAIAPSSPNTIYVATGEWTPGWGPGFPGTGVFVRPMQVQRGHSAPPSRRAEWRKWSSLPLTRIASTWLARAVSNARPRGCDVDDRCAPGRSPTPSSTPMPPTRSTSTFGQTASTSRPTGGATWTKLAGGAPSGVNADWIRLAIGNSGAAGSNLVLAKRSGTLYRTTDGGGTWTTLAGSHGASAFHEWCNLVAVAPDNDDVILAGGVGIERTANGGTTWGGLGGLHSATIAQSSHPPTRTSPTPVTTAACTGRPTRGRPG